jgi:hypothetical protein
MRQTCSAPSRAEARPLFLRDTNTGPVVLGDGRNAINIVQTEAGSSIAPVFPPSPNIVTCPTPSPWAYRTFHSRRHSSGTRTALAYNKVRIARLRGSGSR